MEVLNGLEEDLVLELLLIAVLHDEAERLTTDDRGPRVAVAGRRAGPLTCLP
ncbi:hypothetical protein [Nonomuraea sp. KM90]|uniref:hypothetical protein n=1 Tax=Nonomuraea sp. KM90 TaxID=3457428 RepID=UPI003FCC7B68